jgi:hypothetical protein
MSLFELDALLGGLNGDSHHSNQTDKQPGKKRHKHLLSRAIMDSRSRVVSPGDLFQTAIEERLGCRIKGGKTLPVQIGLNLIAVIGAI